MSKDIRYYRVTPVYEEDLQGGFLTAAVLYCMMTGKILANSGGGSEKALSVEAIEMIDYRRNDGARIVCDEADLMKVLQFVENADMDEETKAAYQRLVAPINSDSL